MSKPKIQNLQKSANKKTRAIQLKFDILSDEAPVMTYSWDNKPIDCIPFKTNLEKAGPGKWIGTIRVSETRNSKAGIYQLIATNSYGSYCLNLTMYLVGFNRPEFARKPRQTFDVDDHRVLTVGVKSLDGGFEENWYRNGDLIDKNDKIFQQTQKKKGSDEVDFNLKIMNDYVSGVFKLVVSNKCGELHAEYEIENVPQKPHLCGKVEIIATDTYVTIKIPFVSHSMENEIRWTVDRKFTEDVFKNESYRQYLYRTRWNQHEVRLQFNIKAVENRRYRCEIWNEAGKMEAFADVRVVEDCEIEKREFYAITHIAYK